MERLFLTIFTEIFQGNMARDGIEWSWNLWTMFGAQKGVFFWRTTHDHGEILLEVEEAVTAPFTNLYPAVLCHDFMNTQDMFPHLRPTRTYMFCGYFPSTRWPLKMTTCLFMVLSCLLCWLIWGLSTFQAGLTSTCTATGDLERVYIGGLKLRDLVDDISEVQCFPSCIKWNHHKKYLHSYW